jgi:NADH-quinone oxidoreductase subunit L
VPDLLDKVWILPAVMAASFVLILFFGKRAGTKATSGIGIASVGICLILAFVVAGQWIQRVDDPPPVAGHGSETEVHGTESESHATEAEEEHAAVTVEAPSAGVGTGETAASVETAAAAEGEGEGGEAEEHHVVEPVVTSITWFQSGDVTFDAGTITDGLSAMMLVTVTIISLLVHVYSTEYLRGDVRYTHYYAFLSLFTASMLFYVVSSNTLQMLVGWELVGLCSFGLIGHWWEEQKNSDAALKAFLTNRVGDVGLLLGVIITFFAAGATSFGVLHINEYALTPAANTTLLLVGALCLFGGVTSKSGQFPLHTWLPDAMAGPTPVSALIHAATMVVAGVYLIARMYPVFWSGLAIGSSSLHYVALIGGLTTVIGGALAFVQYDLKKVLAYSTISQLGYMVMALGVGAWTAGVFHLFTHAFFKACLFLGAGSVSHACHHTFDMREMGGLRKHMKSTHITFLIATLALAGIFPLAGFWSKDEILAGAQQGQENAYTLMLVFGLITAFMTAAYMGRAYWMTFWGEYRGHGTPHESPKVITVPLWILAACAVVLGFTNLPTFFNAPEWATTRFEHFIEPTFAFPAIEHPEFTPWLAVLSMALAVGGLLVAYAYFEKQLGPHGLTSRNKLARGGYTFLENKYYLDHLYTDIVVGSTKGPIARSANWFNQNVLDGIVNGAATVAKRSANFVYKVFDQLVVDGVVNGSGLASEESGQLLRRIQTGKVQQYGALLFAAAAVLAGVFVFVV